MSWDPLTKRALISFARCVQEALPQNLALPRMQPAALRSPLPSGLQHQPSPLWPSLVQDTPRDQGAWAPLEFHIPRFGAQMHRATGWLTTRLWQVARIRTVNPLGQVCLGPGPLAWSGLDCFLLWIADMPQMEIPKEASFPSLCAEPQTPSGLTHLEQLPPFPGQSGGRDPGCQTFSQPGPS